MELPSPMYLGSGGSDPSQLGYHDPHMGGGLSLQEMIDTDIKADFEDVLQNNPISFQGMDSLDMLNDLDTITFLGGGASSASGAQFLPSVSAAPAVTSNNSTLSHNPHQTSYVSFSNSYLEDMTGSASVMVNPNNVMPIHPLQHQQVASLSVNTASAGPVSPGSPMASPIYQTTTTATAAQQQQIQQQHQQQQQQQQQQHFRPQPGSKSVRVLPPVSSPMQQVPSPGPTAAVANNSTATNRKKSQKNAQAGGQGDKENGYPKPAYSYSCLIALALKNSQTGSMSVSEIYKFMCEHFPYFKNAPSGWKNSVRHNLSLNKCFEKIEKPTANGNQRKGCLWAMNPNKIQKMNEEVQKWSRKDPLAIKKGMANPAHLPALERGDMKKDYNANTPGVESEDEEEPRTPTSVSSQGSQGYDSAGSDFVDIEGFSQITPIPDSSLPELSLQASGGGVYDDLGDDRLTFASATVSDVVVTSGLPATHHLVTSAGHGGESFYPTTIRANYSIAPTATVINHHNGHQHLQQLQQQAKPYHTATTMTTIVNVAQKHHNQKVFSTN